jgi:hypothetical protein
MTANQSDLVDEDPGLMAPDNSLNISRCRMSRLENKVQLPCQKTSVHTLDGQRSPHPTDLFQELAATKPSANKSLDGSCGSLATNSLDELTRKMRSKASLYSSRRLMQSMQAFLVAL